MVKTVQETQFSSQKLFSILFGTQDYDWYILAKVKFKHLYSSERLDLIKFDSFCLHENYQKRRKKNHPNHNPQYTFFGLLCALEVRSI